MIDKRRIKLLVIECNAPKLKAQGLSYSETLIRAASLVLPEDLIHLIQTKDRELIPSQFTEAKQKSKNYSGIAIIDLSGSNGKQLGENVPYKWESLSNWLKLFNPQKIF